MRLRRQVRLAMIALLWLSAGEPGLRSEYRPSRVPDETSSICSPTGVSILFTSRLDLELPLFPNKPLSRCDSEKMLLILQ